MIRHGLPMRSNPARCGEGVGLALVVSGSGEFHALPPHAAGVAGPFNFPGSTARHRPAAARRLVSATIDVQGWSKVKARVYVSFKPSVLDPQGQTIRAALNGLGHQGIEDVR